MATTTAQARVGILGRVLDWFYPSESAIEMSRRLHWGRVAFAVLTLLLALYSIRIRTANMDGKVFEPHIWRQAETARITEGLYRNGMDILHPEVAWMGRYKHISFELPLPEALVAGVYHLFGDRVPVAKSTYFALYLVGLIYLVLLARNWSRDPAFPWLVGMFYLTIPIALYYSMSQQVDFSVVSCSLAFWWHARRVLQRFRWVDALAATLFFFLGAAVKAPYMAVVGLPLLVENWDAIRKSPVSKLATMALIGLPGVAVFLWWRSYSDAANQAAPLWKMIPGYMIFTDLGSWYYGTWDQRTDPHNWYVLRERLHQSLGLVGLSLMMLGMVWTLVRRDRVAVMLAAWAVGVCLYAITFFNLNLWHDYYHMPFLPLVAVLMAMALKPVWERSMPAACFALALYGASYNNQTKTFFFRDEPLSREAGEFVQKSTPENALVLIGMDEISFGNPFYLWQARRDGFNVSTPNLTASLLQFYKEQGVEYLVMIGNNNRLEDAAIRMLEGPMTSVSSDGRLIEVYPLKR